MKEVRLKEIRLGHLHQRKMLNSQFTSGQQCHLGAALTILLAAAVLYANGRERQGLIMLTLAALLLRSFAILLDPYLNFWDEVYHAVVGSNMAHHPFTPRLHTVDAMPTGTNWMNTGIWLHKPPFFLWQIALSVASFGAESWAVRVPSALWTAALVPVTYRIAVLVTGDRKTAFMAATGMACSFYLQEITSGALNTDHNDAVFVSIVVFSWWALLEHLVNGSRRWALLAGLFSAAAVLTKWYVGLSVFLPWSLILVLDRSRSRSAVNLFMALGVLVLVVGAWIARMFWLSPEQAMYEWGFKTSHLTSTIAAHAGSWSYHLDIIQKLLRPWSTFLVVLAFAWLVIKVRSAPRIFIVSIALGIHLLFGFAQTKMPSYTMVLLPIYIIALAHMLICLLSLLPKRIGQLPLPLAFAGLLFGVSMLAIQRTHDLHTLAVPLRTDQDPRRAQLAMFAAQTKLLTLLNDTHPKVIFNIPAPHDLQFMFRSGYDSMDGIPTQDQANRLQASGYEVIVVDHGAFNSEMPQGVRIISAERLGMPRPTH